MRMWPIQFNQINLREEEELGGFNLTIIGEGSGEDINEGSLEEKIREGELDKTVDGEDFKLREDLIIIWEDI